MQTRYLPLSFLLLCGLLLAFSGRAHSSSSAGRTVEFIENKGQWDARSRYEADLRGGRLFLEATGMRLVLGQNISPPGHGPKASANAPAPDTPLRAHALVLEFVGAAAVPLRAGERTEEHRNYFRGADPARWAHDVRSYRQVQYPALWPGIGARVYENDSQQLEYDFELAPNADPSAIAIRHLGAEALRLDAEGSLQLTTSVGTLTEKAPQAWQTDAQGRRQPVACRYVLRKNVVSFALGRYDRRRPLTIDPVVVFSTYSGSSATNWGFTATYDQQGNLYSGGIAFGFGFPVTPGAFQTTFGGEADMALIKYNVSQNGPGARVWATLIGGNDWDFPHSLVVNNQGELLVLGSSASRNYPVTATAAQRLFGGGSYADPFGIGGTFGGAYEVPNGTDIVVSRLSATGSALLGSTFLGGSSSDGLVPLSPFSTLPQLPHNYGDPFRGDIVVDAQDNVYIASSTTSANFPGRNSFGNLYNGGSSDGLVCKLTPDLSAVLWAGLLGGSGADAAYSIQLEPGTGDVYVAGGTLSADFPVTGGAYQATRSGDVDGFVVRILQSGSRITRSTYLGTSAYDQAYFLQLGTDGGVYVLGQTMGNYPVTPGLYNTPNGTQFIHKLDANLSATQLAMVFGSGVRTVNITPTAFLVDRCDRVYVCGWGGDDNLAGSFNTKPYLSQNGTTFGLPTTPGAVQTNTDGDDFYLAQFTAGLTGLGYGTFYGNTAPNSEGDHVDGGTSRFDPRGIVYQSVCSCFSGTGFPMPAGANSFSTTNGDPFGCNNAAFVFNFQPGIAAAGADQTVCATAAPFPLVGSPGGGIWSGPAVSGSVATGFTFTPSPALTGVQTLTYTVVSTGLCTTTANRRVTVTPGLTASFTALPPLLCSDATTPPPPVQLQASPAGGSFSGPGVSGSVFTPAAAGNGTHTLSYTYSNGGCSITVPQAVQVLLVTSRPNQTVCANAAPIPLTGSPAGGSWAGPGVSGSVATGFVFTPAQAPAGPSQLTYSVTATGTGGTTCTASSSATINVQAVPSLSLTPLPPLCVAAGPQPLVGSPAGGIWTGPGVSGNPTAGFFFSPAIGPGSYQLTYTLGAAVCPATGVLPVTVAPTQSVSVPADTTLCPGSTQPFRLRASPAGGSWAGPGVSGSVAAGFVFTLPANFAGTASLVYSVAGTCPGTATRRVAVAAVPQLQPTWMPVACAEDRQAPLTVRFSTPTAAGELSWDFGDGSAPAQGFEVSHTYAAAGRYTPQATLRYLNGQCQTQARLTPVEVVDQRIPNVFTPGTDDQLNSSFRLPPGCAPRIQLFSRWGQRVFEAPAYQNDWRAEGQPAGLYYYLLEYPDGRRIRGWVEVIK
ncbi:hypothetical protein GCM10023185_08390 [Hymenobacter saemangeumensis]|uniref:PKD domain-containing protein n=1 Tax=Hymenobacter saemangeumensis TaxID=1084522 RepID=A0ABP8I3I0_9BACT